MRPPEDQPGEAAEYALLRISPDGAPVPVSRYHQAIGRMKRMGRYSTALRRKLDSKARELTVGAWTQLGPGNFGGRTRALLVHPEDPQILYAGAVAGGIWRSTNGGNAWTPLGDFLPFLSVSTLAMDSRDSRVIYAGTGEGFLNGDGLRGGGIYQTADGGDSWTLLESTKTSDFFFTQKIAISPNDPRRLYAATNAGLMVSSDRGESWTLAIDRRAPNTGCHDIVLRTDMARDFAIVSCGISRSALIGATNRNLFGAALDLQSPGTIFRNPDVASGAPWTAVLTDPNMARVSLAFAPSDQNVVYALASSNQDGPYRDGMLAFYRSLSGGELGTWQARVRNTDTNKLNTLLLTNPFIAQCTSGTPNSQGPYDNVIAVDPMDANRVWAGGIDLMRSDDGGANWGLASFWWTDASAHADHHAIVFHPNYNGVTNQIVFNSNDGGVYRSDNARAATATGPSAACNPDNSAIRWRSLNNGYVVAQFYHGSVFPGGHLYVGGLQDNGSVVGSDTRGVDRWSRVLGGDGTFAHINPEDPASFFVSTPGFALAKTNDGGASFFSARSGISGDSGFLFNTPVAMDPREPQRMWAGGTFLWRTTNGAQRWERASATFPDGVASSVAVSPFNPNLVLAGTTRGWIHRLDSALTAGSNTAWPGVQPRLGFVSEIVFDPVDAMTVYAVYSTFLRDAGEAHIYRSRDQGETWESIDGSGDTAIPDIPVSTLAIDPNDTNILYAGTDLGVFVSLDGGATWLKEEMGAPNTSIWHFTVARAGRFTWLYAFTHGRGVWRVPLSQSGAACSYTLSSPSTRFNATGGTATIFIDAPPDCPWTALSRGDTGLDWITIDRGASGAGSGSVQIRAGSTDVARSGIIYVADKAHSVSQTAGTFQGTPGDEATVPTDIAVAPSVGYFDMRQATSSPGDPVNSCSGARDPQSVWFRYVPNFTGQLQVVAMLNSRPVLTVYNGVADRELEAGCARPAGLPAELVVPVTEGRAILIRVSSATGTPAASYLGLTLRRAAPALDVPLVLDFGDIPSGHSYERILAVKNTGNAPLDIISVTTVSPLVEVVTRGPLTVPHRPEYPAIGEPSRQIVLRFTPPDVGAHQATINLATNDPARAGVTVRLVAHGK
ncbi:MAG: hypothetical protein HY820_20265 [Acidobacteria bacterium]|nr:hypothetical protein [Acidobacteriota bacterium]